jgi:hypothetical protein
VLVNSNTVEGCPDTISRNLVQKIPGPKDPGHNTCYITYTKLH